MAGLLDLLMQARESGRGARADLENSINYYIPPELRGLLGFAAEANPVVSMERAGQDAQRLVQPGLSGWDRMAAAGDMASNMAGVLAPMAAGRAVGMPAVRALEEGLLGMSMTPEAAALRQFAGDEFGGFTLYQGSPHNFSAERLVRMPDGSTQYVVGAPDVLPDVPAGAKVLRDFPLGRQRMDKIGTGEGAQAYGYGLYGAEAEGVARNYRNNLAGNAQGTPYVADNVRGWLESTGGDYSKAAAEAKSYLREYGDQMDNDQLAELKNAIYLLDREKDSFGSMYEMQVNADPEAFLDWDKPLSEQPQVAQRLGYSTISADAINEEAMRIFEAMPGGAWMKDPVAKARIDELQEMFDRTVPDQTGAEYYRGGSEGDVSNLLSQMGYGNPQEASAALREAGIPGIKFLDAGSRGADAGSRNFVIFDENLIDIVRKYGIAGAAAMLGASQADVAQAMQQQRPQGLLSGPQ